MTPYEPPKGMLNFVRVIQACTPVDAADLLALTFRHCAAAACTQELRLLRERVSALDEQAERTEALVAR